jgi:hypothetical protein
VRHPNVVEVFGAGQIDGEPYLAMEYVEGVDLFRLLRRLESETRSLSIPLCVYLARRVAAALSAVHSAKATDGSPLDIVHRDVTPSNVYLSTDGDVKLGDFGIARMTAPRVRASQPTVGLKGKFGYLAPEQIAGEPFDCRADLFALAVVFGEMLIGERVFPGSGQLAVLLAIRDGNYEPLRQRENSLPPAIYAVCLKGLAREPAARFQSADEFGEALEPYELPSGPELREELAALVRWAADSKQLAQRLKGQIRDSVDRMRAVRLAHSGLPPRVSTTPPTVGSVAPSRPSKTPFGGVAVPAGGLLIPSEGATFPSEGATFPSGGATFPSGGATFPSGGATFPSRGATLPPRISEVPPRISEAPPQIVDIDEGASLLPLERDSVPPFCAETRSERVVASVRFRSGKVLVEVGFPRLVELIATGELRAEDEVALMGEAFCPVGEVASLARYLMPSTTATTARLSPVGVPDYHVELEDTPLLEILARLRVAADTGALFVGRRDADGTQKRKEIYVRDGRLLHVASSERDELLGEYLIRRGALERHELEFALDRIARRGGRLGDTLVSMCIVDGVDVFRAIRDLGRDRVAALCGWAKGSASFYRGTVPSHVEFPLDLDLASPMMAGVLVATNGLPGFVPPAPTRLVIPGPRAPSMASRRERGTVPLALLLVQQLATRGLTVEACIAEEMAVRTSKDSRSITEREASAALAVAKILGWITFQ